MAAANEPSRRRRSAPSNESSSSATASRHRNAMNTEIRFHARMSGVISNSNKLDSPPTVPTASAIATPTPA